MNRRTLLQVILFLHAAPDLVAQERSTAYKTIEVYSMSFNTSHPFDYSAQYLIRLFEDSGQGGMNLSNRFKYVLNNVEIERISDQLHKLVSQPDTSRILIIDTRVAIRITSKDATEYLIGFDSSKRATINGHYISTGRRIFRLINKCAPGIGQ